VVEATIGAGGELTVTGTPTSLLGGCAGAADRTVVDVSGPDVHHDGATVAFAMRLAQSQPRQVWTVGLDGSGCEQVTSDEPAQGGILIHNFDPAWSLDGVWIVYASTRGTSGSTPAPSRSRRLFLPQSDIWRLQVGDPSNREQMTFLTNSEISPQFMREGRLIMTTEKVSETLYQLAGRRINWDLTDYHPLLAQRKEGPFGGPPPGDPDVTVPSVGYERATEIREGFNGDFLLVFSDHGVRGGAGTIGIFNRSVGTFEMGRADEGLLRSVVIPDPSATGRPGAQTTSAYRSPFPLLDGRILASHAVVNGDLGTATALAWQLVALDRRTGQRQVLLAPDGGRALVEAVVALKKPPHELYYNRRQLVFGGAQDTMLSGGAEWSVMHFPDAPLIFTLLNANARRGRPTDRFRDAAYLAVYHELEANPQQTAPNLVDIYQSRTFLGRAPLAGDGSVKIRAPAGVGLILELQDSSGDPIVTMLEEHQVGPGENITFGIGESLFDAVCGGCHGTV
jgi:hypothetical protein